MNKSCFGFKINRVVFCRSCGTEHLKKTGGFKGARHIEELHAEASSLRCSACQVSLGESEGG